MDLESKDLLELVRGRDRTEFQHLKSEIYRFVIEDIFILYKEKLFRPLLSRLAISYFSLLVRCRQTIVLEMILLRITAMLQRFTFCKCHEFILSVVNINDDKQNCLFCRLILVGIY